MAACSLDLHTRVLIAVTRALRAQEIRRREYRLYVTEKQRGP